MDLRTKLDHLNHAISREAHKLGLMFVNGPDAGSLSADMALKPDVGHTNGQLRGVYLFAVAEFEP